MGFVQAEYLKRSGQREEQDAGRYEKTDIAVPLPEGGPRHSDYLLDGRGWYLCPMILTG
jgi:hypothetical protein